MRRSQKPRRSRLHSTAAADRKRAVTDLSAALAAQNETVSAALEERLLSVLEEGEAMPDARLLFRLMARLAERAAGELDAADAGRFLGTMRISVLRHEIGREKAALYGEAVKVRKALVELYGSAHCRFRFGLSERTPRGAAGLAVEARRLLTRLSEKQSARPTPGLPGQEADPEGWAEALEPPLERLERLLAQKQRRQLAAGDEAIARRRALAACDETHSLVARAAEALFRLAGEKELARRLPPAAWIRDGRVAAPQSPAARARRAVARVGRWLHAGFRRLFA